MGFRITELCCSWIRQVLRPPNRPIKTWTDPTTSRHQSTAKSSRPRRTRVWDTGVHTQSTFRRTRSLESVLSKCTREKVAIWSYPKECTTDVQGFSSSSFGVLCSLKVRRRTKWKSIGNRFRSAHRSTLPWEVPVPRSLHTEESLVMTSLDGIGLYRRKLWWI